MQASAYLAAVLVFAVPTSALTNPPPETLLALHSVSAFGVSGAEFARYFDASARQAFLNIPHSTGRPVLVRSRPKPPAKKAPAPFMLEIPALTPPAYERNIERLAARPRANSYDGLIAKYARDSGLDPRLIKSVIAAESEFTPRAKSPAGALGLMQLMPATSEEMGISRKALYEPEANIRAGTLYLVHLFQRAWRRYHLKGVAYKDAPPWLVQRILAAYNAGPRFLKRRPLYRQTRDYVKKVLLFYRSKVSELKVAAL